MRRPVGSLLFAVLSAWLVLMGGASEPESLEQLRKDTRIYHKQFMEHMEASLAKLNESLYDWREQGRPHSHLGALASHSVEVLTNLEDLVSSDASELHRRKLHQIYDEASRQAAEERLAGVTAEAEARYEEAIQLLQSAAATAIQNNTEDLMAQFAEKLRANGVVSTGKIISDQLQALQLADNVAEKIRGLVPEFNSSADRGLGDVLSGGLSGLGDGIGNLFGGSLLNRLRKGRGEAPAPEMAAPAPEVQEDLNVELANEDDILLVSTENPNSALIGQPVQVSSSVSVTPLQRDSEDNAASEIARNTNEANNPVLGEEVSRADFYQEINDVFDRFDGESGLSGQANTQRRALRSTDESSIDADAIISGVESSLETLRSMRERRIAVSKEMTEAIKARAADARQRFKDMVSGISHSSPPGRRLQQFNAAVDEQQKSAEDGFLIFPGEPEGPFSDRTKSDEGGDKIIDEDSAVMEEAPVKEAPVKEAPVTEEPVKEAPVKEAPVTEEPVKEAPVKEVSTEEPVDESSSAIEDPPMPDDDQPIIVMPMMPIVSQEINFVFIPMDAEALIKSVAEVLMSTMAQAAVPMMPADEYIFFEVDLGLFDAYDASYELPDGTAPIGFGPVEIQASSNYHEPVSATQRRRRLKSSVQSMTNLLEDSYDLELYLYDPTWFNSASKLMLDGDSDQDIAELSLAIRFGGPEDLGGLPPDVLLFLAESEAIMDAMMSGMMTPSYSVFDASADQAKAHADNENLADTIVHKLQSAYGAYGAYGQPARAQGLYSSDPRGYSTSDFDLKWLGVMFGAVGIVLIIAIGAITAFQSRAQTPPGYVVIEDIRAIQPQHQAPSKSTRKTSNLPA